MPDQPKEKTEQQLAEDFIKEYEALVKKHQFQIVVTPAFKSMTDTGTFNVVLQSSVGRISQKEE